MHRAHPCLSSVSIGAALGLALALSAVPASAAADYYLKLGDIKGEAAGKDHKGEIEILSWSWGAAEAAKGGNVEYQWKVEEGESAPPKPGGSEDTGVGEPPESAGTPTGKRQHKPLTVTKRVDKATPKLAEAAAKGKVLMADPARGSGSLAAVVPAGMCRAGARYPSAELGTGSRVYRMADVVVASCSAAPSSGGGDRPMESISLNYTKISW